jgi:heme exporter protein CcmD
MSDIQFNSIAEFLQMGGYAVHVWLVYLCFAIFIGYNLLSPRFTKKQFIRTQRRRAVRDEEERQRVEVSTDA